MKKINKRCPYCNDLILDAMESCVECEYLYKPEVAERNRNEWKLAQELQRTSVIIKRSI